jgi:hypothetical protein
VLEGGRVYRLTAQRMPGFLVYDEKTQQPCFRVPPDARYSEADVVAAINARGRRKHQITISLTSEADTSIGRYASYMTSREYDLAAMYQTFVKEGHQRCSF